MSDRFTRQLSLFIGRLGLNGAICRVLDWQLAGEAVEGHFRSGDRAYEFTIDAKGLHYGLAKARSDSYWQGRAMQESQASRYAGFARRSQSAAYAEGFLNRADSREKSKCSGSTSIACGRTCISSEHQCHLGSAEVRTQAKWAVAQAKLLRLGMSSSASPASSEATVPQGLGGLSSASFTRNEAAIAKRLKLVEDDIRGITDREDMVAIDNDGKVITRIRGEATSVGISPEVAVRLRGATITHNHPTWRYAPDDPRLQGRSFSLPDISAATQLDLGEMRAAAPGYTYSLKPGKNGWGNYPLMIQPTYTKHAVLTHMELSKAIREGKKTANQAEAEFQGMIVQRVAKDMGWTYTEQKRSITAMERNKAKKLARTHGDPNWIKSGGTAVSSATETMATALRGAIVAAFAVGYYHAAMKAIDAPDPNLKPAESKLYRDYAQHAKPKRE